MILLTKLVRQNLPDRPIRVLDAGCGNRNFVIDELSDRWSEKIGLDASPEVARLNTCLDKIDYGRLEKLPFKDASFDCVISLWVFEHVEDPLNVFKEIHRVLKPGGIFAFVTPNKNGWIVRARSLIPSHLAEKIVETLYGRKEEDIFDVFYRTNTVHNITRLAQETTFTIRTLHINADPSYTCFGPVSYRLSSWLSKYDFFKPHLISVLQKTS